ncbi:MAG: preprotein translocase subunit SecE [Clostridia bacterium]|nr:preprotein translocase subunit SecE [Clostridia bacterium]
MAEENMNLSAETTDTNAVEATAANDEVVSTKKEKVAKTEKKPNIFVRLWNGTKKLCRDTFNEMKKVRWTPKNELIKSTVLVVVAVCATALALGLIDMLFSFLIDAIASLFG